MLTRLQVKMTRKGFTLLEVLIYIGVLVIIILTISSYLIWFIQSSTKIKVMAETLDNARRAMETIVYEVREAESVYIPTSVFDSNPGQLSLETTKYIPTDEGKTYIDFYVSNGRLCLKKESQNPICLTSDRVEVANLVFSQIDTANSFSVQIDLSIDYKNPTGRPEYQSQVNLRSVASLRSY